MADRVYNIPLRKEWLKVPGYKRSKKAVKAVKEFLARHMRTDIENVRVGKWLNQDILKRGRHSPPHHVNVNVTKEGILVRAELKDLPKKALEEIKKEEERKSALEKKKKEKEKAGESEKETKPEDKTEAKPVEDKEKEKALKKEVKQEKPSKQQNVRQQNKLIQRKALQK